MGINKKGLVLLILVLLFTMILGQTTMAVSLNIKSDVVKMMDNIYVRSDEVVNGDAVSIGGNVVVDGIVNGDVVAIGGNVTVRGKVNGSATAIGGNIIMEDSGFISGEKVSIGINLPNINIGNRNPYGLPGHNMFDQRWKGFGNVFSLVTLIALGLLVSSFMPNQVTKMSRHLTKDFWRIAFVGFISLILMPFLLVVTLITIIGIPLVPAIIFAFVIGKFIGYIAITVFVGRRISELPNWNLSIIMQMLIGIVVLWVIRSIPILGGFSYVVVTILALGLIIETKFGSFNPWFPKKNNDAATVDYEEPKKPIIDSEDDHNNKDQEE